jgi:hypothetical protein
MNDQLIKVAFEQIVAEAKPTHGNWASVERRIRREGYLKHAVVVVSIAAVVAAVLAVPRLKAPERAGTFADTPAASITPGSATYADTQNRFQVSYPSSWTLAQPSDQGWKIASPNGAVIIGFLIGPGMPYTYHGCDTNPPEAYVTGSSSTETIAGEPAMKCTSVITRDGAQVHRVTYNIDWTGRLGPDAPPCRSQVVCTDSDSLYFLISAPTSSAWDQYGATAEEIVQSITWLDQ